MVLRDSFGDVGAGIEAVTKIAEPAFGQCRAEDRIWAISSKPAGQLDQFAGAGFAHRDPGNQPFDITALADALGKGGAADRGL